MQPNRSHWKRKYLRPENRAAFPFTLKIAMGSTEVRFRKCKWKRCKDRNLAELRTAAEGKNNGPLVGLRFAELLFQSVPASLGTSGEFVFSCSSRTLANSICALLSFPVAW